MSSIKATIGKGFLKEQFGGKPYIHCVVEAAVKNSRDWEATLIHLETRDPKVLVIVDNGVGLNGENRNAFLSVNKSSSARDPKKSGWFGTGSKQFLFSHASSVRVRTAPKEEPTKVYVFEFTTDEYEDLVFRQGELKPTVLKKNPETWPHMRERDGVMQHEFGTEITYQLARPNSSAIYRGERLARRLSDRLPRKFQDIITVDDLGYLPPKEMIGSAFHDARPIPLLGVVDVDVYRPKNHASEDGLRLTSHEVGEATMHSFMLAISGIRTPRLDKIYAHPEVCGTIGVVFVKEYATETRDSVNPSIADDQRTLMLIRHLNQLAPDIARTLKIERAQSDETDDSRVIADFVAMVNNRYLPEGERPPLTPGEPDDEPDDDSKDPHRAKRPHGQVLSIDIPHEVEIGQEFTVTARIRRDLTKTYTATDVEWHYVNAKSTRVRRNDDGTLTLVANELGVAYVTATIPGTPYHDARRFTVVRDRIFTIHPSAISTEIGRRHVIHMSNADKLKGTAVWTLEGVGQLNPTGEDRAHFIATRPGRARITCKSSIAPLQCGTCDVHVTARALGMRMYFKGTWYDVEVGHYRTDKFRRPVVILDNEPMPRMCINAASESYRAIRQRGRLMEFIALAAAMEHARFMFFRTHNREDQHSRIEDHAEAFSEDIAAEGYEAYLEMLRNHN